MSVFIFESCITQGEWVEQQASGIRQQKLRCEHLLHVLSEEISKDEQRELRMLARVSEERQRKAVIATVAKERTEAADRIIRILEG